MEELAKGRSVRLGRIIEILEASHEMGERLDVDVVQEVLDGVERELEEAARGVPQGASELTPEEYRIALMLSGLCGALRDAVAYLEQHSRWYRFRNELKRQHKALETAVWEGMIARLPQRTAMALAVEATSWSHAIWSPVDRNTLLDLLAEVAADKRVKRERRETAEQLLSRLDGLRRARQASAG